MPAKECPSGKYLDELVTASGLSLQHPTEDPGSTLGVPHSLLDWSGSEHDFAEWDALGRVIIGRMEKSWAKLKGWPATSRMPVAQYDEIVGRINDVRVRDSLIRKPWRAQGSSQDPAWVWGYSGPDFAWDATDDIQKMTQLIVDAQCLRQHMDELLTSMGGDVELPSDTGPKKSPEGPGLLGTAALIASAITIVVGVPLILRKVVSKKP